MNGFKMFGFVLFVVFMIAFGQLALGAGGGEATGPSLGGSFYPSGYGGSPNYGSSLQDYGTNAGGSFWINLDGSKDSLTSANWQFNAPAGNSTNWTAECNLHGLLSTSSSNYSKNWSSSYSTSAGVTISANTNVNSYDQNGWQISNLQSQIATYQLQLLTDPNNATLKLEIQLDQLQVQLLKLNDPQILSVSGNLNVNPSTTTGSNFRYWEGTDNVYTWPNGYNNPPVVTTVPSWSAEYDMYGVYSNGSPVVINPPIGGLGASSPYPNGVEAVPEPGTWAMLLAASLGGLLMIRRR